jgi:pimeloyl-ACP methyl ester carboxylesterase
MSEAAPRLGAIETEGMGPPVVLLHGFGGSASSWKAVQEKLGKAALAFDLPGHAGSLNYPGFGSASLAAKAVVRELDQRGIEAFHLAGHSMGGGVAALIAIGQPSRVLSATLLAPGGMSSRIDAPLLRAYAKAGNRQKLEACLRRMSGRKSAIPAEIVGAMMAQRRVPEQMEALAHIVERILRGEEQGVIPRAALEALTMPVTLVWGAEDAVMPCDVLISVPRSFHTVLLPDAGHMLPDEAPQQAAAAIAETIARAAA